MAITAAKENYDADAHNPTQQHVESSCDIFVSASIGSKPQKHLQDQTSGVRTHAGRRNELQNTWLEAITRPQPAQKTYLSASLRSNRFHNLLAFSKTCNAAPVISSALNMSPAKDCRGTRKPALELQRFPSESS